MQVKLLRYIELKSGHSDNGPAWIAYVEQSKTGRTLYFNGRGLMKLKGQRRGAGGGNYVDMESSESFWVSGEGEGVRLELAKCVTSQNSEDDMFRSGARALRPERRAARPSSENAVFAKIPESLAARPDLIGSRLSNALLSTNELADLIGFAPKTIRRWASRRLLNFIRVGNQFRFRPAAVELFLAQREIRK